MDIGLVGWVFCSGCSFNGCKPGGTGMLWTVVDIG